MNTTRKTEIETTVKAALELASAGFHVHPLPPYEKQPPRKNWETRPDYTEDEIAAWVGNYGIRCGDRDLFVVDADSPDARKWVDANLPRTPLVVSTRQGAHYYYRTPNGKTLRRAKDAEQSIDTRGVGGYVVGPDCYRKDLGDIERAWKPIPPFDLDVALPYLEARDLLALASVMKRAGGVTVEPGVFTRGAGSHELHFEVDKDWNPPEVYSEWVGVGDGLRNSAAYHIADELIYKAECPYNLGLARLLTWASLCSPNVRSDASKEYKPRLAKQVWVSRWANSKAWRDQKSGYGSQWLPAPKLEDVPQAPKNAAPWELPDGLDVLPGRLNHFVEYYMRTSPVPMRDMAVFSALAFGSVVASRRYSTTSNGYSSLFFCTVAQSGNGKESGRKVINEVLREAGRDWLVGGSGYTSPGALVTALKRSPNHVAYFDELGDRLTGLKKNGSELQMWAALREVWGQCDSAFMPTMYSREGRGGQGVEKHSNILRPGVTVFGMSTPKQLIRALSDAELENGTVNRFLFNVNQAPQQKLDLEKLISGIKEGVPKELVDWVRVVAKEPQAPSGEDDAPTEHLHLPKTPIVVPFGEGVLDFLSVHWDDKLAPLIAKSEKKGNPEFYVRFNEIAIRLSLILAVSMEPWTPKITVSLIEWSVDYLHHIFKRFGALYEEERVANPYDEIYKATLKVINAAGAAGISLTGLGKVKSIRMKPQDRRDLLESMLLAGDIVDDISPDDKDVVKKRGRPTSLFWGSKFKRVAKRPEYLKPV